jgi:ParB family chromosome partitioning protein
MAELDAAIGAMGDEQGGRAARGRTGIVPIGDQVRAVAADTVQRLAELEQTMAQAVAEGRMVIEVDPVAVVDSPWRDRHEENLADPAFVELQKSLVRNSQLVPVGLRRRHGREDAYEIVYGHRRVRAARALGMKVKAVMIEVDDRALISAMLVENAARKDLSPVERGRAYRRILQAGLHDRQGLAEILAVSPQQVSNLTKLAEIPDAVLELVGDWRGLSINEGQRLVAALAGCSGLIPDDLAERVRASRATPSVRARMLTNGLKEGDNTLSDREGIVLRARDGRRLARLSRSGRQIILRFQPDLDATKVETLARRLADLWSELEEDRSRT